jgi:alpha-L-fucosidase
MLSIPLPGNGMPDEDELKLLDALSRWIATNGEGIYGTRPWMVYGEGPSTTDPARPGAAADTHAYTPQDMRFTKKGEVVYAFLMGWPAKGRAAIKSLAVGSPHFPKAIAQVELLGAGAVKFTRDADGLAVLLPQEPPCDFACALKVTPA